MKFIELTSVNSNLKLFINIHNILNIFPKDGKTIIVQSSEEYYTVTESYEEVKKLLQ